MTGEELHRRLDGRTLQWLAAELGVSRNTVWKWRHGREAIPEERAEQIRDRLPMPDQEVRGDDGG